MCIFNTIVKANTGGSARVMTTKSIDARANTGGSITYKGDPKKVNRNKAANIVLDQPELIEHLVDLTFQIDNTQ